MTDDPKTGPTPPLDTVTGTLPGTLPARLPNTLRAWREFRGLSRAKLADAVDTNTNMILYLETGERSLSDRWVRRLAQVLKIPAGWLFDDPPGEMTADIVDIWGPATMRQRRQIIELAAVIVKTGTDD